MISRCSTQFRDKAELLSNFPINWPAIMIRPYQSGLLGHDLKPRDIFRIVSGLISVIMFCIFCFPPWSAYCLTWYTDQCIMWGQGCNWPLSHWRRESGDQDRWCWANALTCCDGGAVIFTFTTLDIITRIMIPTISWTLRAVARLAKVNFVLDTFKIFNIDFRKLFLQ